MRSARAPSAAGISAEATATRTAVPPDPRRRRARRRPRDHRRRRRGSIPFERRRRARGECGSLRRSAGATRSTICLPGRTSKPAAASLFESSSSRSPTPGASRQWRARLPRLSSTRTPGATLLASSAMAANWRRTSGVTPRRARGAVTGEAFCSVAAEELDDGGDVVPELVGGS